VIVAVAIAVSLTPSREGLIERWLRANRTHSEVRLESGPPALPNRAAPPSDLRALAQRELGIVGRYRLAQPSPPPAAEPWWLQAWRWGYNRWQEFWRALFARVRAGREEAASIGDVLLALVGLALIFAVIRLVRNLQLAGTDPLQTSEPLEEPPAPRALYKQACNAASHGDYSEAAVLLFAATVALLDRQGTVNATSSATVGDLRRQLRARNAALIVPFDEVATPFVQKAYAERAVEEPQWDRARNAFAALLQAGAQP
jgi:hypothetical protein